MKDKEVSMEDQMTQKRIEGIEKIISEAQDCPICDNSGCTINQVSEERYITKDMASDACDMSLEGQLCSEDEFEQEQCQWCYEMPNSKFNLATKISESLEVDEDKVMDIIADNYNPESIINIGEIVIALLAKSQDIIKVKEE